MDIKLKHLPEDCWACKRQKRLNKFCKGYPFGIEFDFIKNAGDFLVNYIYIGIYKETRIPLAPPISVNSYVKGAPLIVFPNKISDEHILRFVKQMKDYIEKVNKLNK